MKDFSKTNRRSKIGASTEAANDAFVEALTTLINSFGDSSLLRDYLDKKGVQHRFAREHIAPEERETKYFERRLEVAIGAPA